MSAPRAVPLAALVALATGTLLLPVPALAQSRTPDAGTWSVSAALFEEGGSGSAGVARMMTDRLELGLELTFAVESLRDDVTPAQGIVDSEARDWLVLVSPTVRWFGLRDRPVSPFLRAAAGVGWGGAQFEVSGTRLTEDEVFRLQGALAVGAEWYPVAWLGVAAHTGLEAVRVSFDRENLTEGWTLDRVDWTVRTFRSGLQVHLYFR